MNVKLRILRTNRTEYVILVDESQDFAALYREWCMLDDKFCDDELPDSEWVTMDKHIRSISRVREE